MNAKKRIRRENQRPLPLLVQKAGLWELGNKGDKIAMKVNVELCSLPVILLVSVSSLDFADKQLLASSFPILERTLHLNIETLGYFSLFSDLSYALSLPFWGLLVHKYGIRKVYILLSVACGSWGCATIGIATFGSSIVGQAIMRTLNGWMLGSILPLSQTLLVELVPSSSRGRAFGIMTVFEKLSGTLATTSVVYFEEKWEYPYYCLGILSIIIGGLVYRHLDPNKRSYLKKYQEETMATLTLRQIVKRIASLPAFQCLVAQGVFGGTPWSMMTFQLLLLDWRGFSKEQIVSIQFASGLAATCGGWIGGAFGDYAASKRSTEGRITVALVSVLCGIPLYGVFLYSTNFHVAIISIIMFHLIASWPPSAAIRPICAELTTNPSERAQIVSMWIMLEKVSGALFGAPLVGFLTHRVLKAKDSIVVSNAEKSSVLAYQLLFLSSLFWAICAFFWILMARSMEASLSQSRNDKLGLSKVFRKAEV